MTRRMGLRHGRDGMEERKVKRSLTLLIPGGIVSVPILEKVTDLARRHGLGVYLSTMQNLRLLDLPEDAEAGIRAELQAMGVAIKGPGLFPLPKVCIGRGYCKLGLADPFALSARIMERFGQRFPVKPKVKIAISACPACCSDAVLKDIGIRATRGGYEVFAGGKGGPQPRAGIRIAKDADEARVLEIIGTLMDFHDRKTTQKQRMCRLLDDPEFPYPPV